MSHPAATDFGSISAPLAPTRLRRLAANGKGAAASLLALPAALLTSAIAQRVLLATMLLNVSLQVEKHFFLQEEARDLGSLGGLQISLTNVALAALCLALLVRLSLERRAAPWAARKADRVTLPAALVVLCYTVSIFAARDRALACFEVVSIVEEFALFWYISRSIRNHDDALFVVRVLMMALVVQSALMLAQIANVVGDVDVYGIKARATFAGDSRVSGTLGSPNPAAAYLAMMMVLCYGALFARLRRLDRYLVRISLAMAAVPLLFTLSRGGWMAFATGLVVVSVCGWRRFRMRRVAWFGIAIFVFALMFRGPIVDRLTGDDNGSAAARMPLNRLAVAMIEDHPIIGFGANNFAVAMRPYVPRNFKGDFLYTVHNKYLLVWSETGLAGLVAFVWLLIAIVVDGWRCWKLQDPVLSPLAIGCAAAVAGLVVQMNLDPSRAGAETHLLWLFGGLIVAMSRLGLTNPVKRTS